MQFCSLCLFIRTWCNLADLPSSYLHSPLHVVSTLADASFLGCVLVFAGLLMLRMLHQICACVDYGQSPKEAEECRRVTIMFIRLLDVHCEPFDYSKAETVNLIQKCICEIYAVLSRYEGTVSRFQIDDKGTGECSFEIYAILGRYEGTISRHQIDHSGTGECSAGTLRWFHTNSAGTCCMHSPYVCLFGVRCCVYIHNDGAYSRTQSLSRSADSSDVYSPRIYLLWC